MAIKTIQVKGTGIRNEREAAAAITPGMLIERTSADKVQAHSNAGQNAARLFAVEDDLQGKDIDTAYGAGDRVQFNVFRPGDWVFALLADGQNAGIGDYLESNGDGYLKVHAAGSAGVVEYPEAIVAQAVEALDLSSSSGAETTQRIKVEII